MYVPQARQASVSAVRLVLAPPPCRCLAPTCCAVTAGPRVFVAVHVTGMLNYRGRPRQFVSPRLRPILIRRCLTSCSGRRPYFPYLCMPRVCIAPVGEFLGRKLSPPWPALGR